jgi:two-component sensor histidine kinase
MSLVPLIILGAISYRVSRFAVRERAYHYVTEIMTEQKNYLNLLMSNVESLMRSLSSQEDIRQVLQDLNVDRDLRDDFKRLSTQAKIGYILSEYNNLDGILSIDLFSMDGVLYHVGETLVAGEIRKSTQEKLFSEAINSKRSVAWVGMIDSVMDSSYHPKTIAAVKVIKALDTQTGEEHPIGILAISYDIHVFNQKFQHKGLTGQIFRIIDQQYQIICDPDIKNIGKTLDPLLKNRMTTQTGLFSTEMDGEDTHVFYSRTENTGWALMSFIRTVRIDEQVEDIARNTLWATAVCAVLAILFILQFSRQVVTPIRIITSRFKEIQAGGQESELHLTITCRGEIGELVRWFNTFLNNQTEKRRLEKRDAERAQELIEVNQALRIEISERKLAEEAMRAALQEKEVLLREIHHRVKNNMQVINSLLSLQAKKVENEDVRQALLESQYRIYAMAMIHETLYNGQNLAFIDLSVYLKNLIHHLREIYDSLAEVSIVFEIDKVELCIDQAVPCGLIINELITNAFKYAFPEGRKGEIQIKVYLTNDKEVVLEVSDNGVGLTPDLDLLNPSSLGLRLVDGLLKHQLEGSMDVVISCGTTFSLRWPLNEGKGENA